MSSSAANEAAVHTAKLRVELSQSRAEQQEYLRNVETARILEKRSERKREQGEHFELKPMNDRKRALEDGSGNDRKKSKRKVGPVSEPVAIESVLNSVF